MTTSNFQLNTQGKLLSLKRPIVMGIINATPDSFYAGSRKESVESVVAQACKMLSEGATILDVGGYSTRPGASEVSVQEETDRAVPAIEAIVGQFPDAIVSVDTFRAKVADAALKAGAAIINDVSGGDLDDGMFDLVAQKNVPYVLMHMKGTPQTMKSLAHYDNLLAEVVGALSKKVDLLHKRGVKDIVIDPGLGFAKTVEQNFELLRLLKEFTILNCPLLVGVSRKSMIWKTLSVGPKDALNGTTVLNTVSLLNGANILRVHDVKEAVEAIFLTSKFW